jgi:transcriptional regulator with XRE-family HTH domain
MQLTLTAARKRRGWKRAELARRTGVHKSTISRLEHGDTLPSYETVALLEAALEMKRNERLVFGHHHEAGA